MWARGLVVLGLATIAGCAASVSTGDPDAAPAPPDATPRPDATPQPVALTQSSDSATITPANSIGCVSQGSGVTRENSYYRAFTLTEHGVTSGFAVSEVTFGVEQAVARNGGAQPATVKLYGYTGLVGATLNPGAMAMLATAPIQIADAPQPTFVSVPITGDVPAGGTFVIEIAIADSDPDEDGDGHVFFVGSNVAGQTKPPYLRAPVTGCDLAVPTQLTMVGPGFPNMHMVLTVTGTPR
jgi:hypothetical protein